MKVATDVAIDSQGRILVAFRATNDSESGGVVRLTQGGALDQTFSQDGIAYSVLTDPNELAVDGQDRVVLAGYRRLVGGGADWEVARLGSNGEVDQSFGNGGIRNLGSPTTISDIVARPDGRIVLASGEAFEGSEGSRLNLRQLTEDGDDDTSFDGDGRLSIAMESGVNRAWITDIDLTPSGRVLVLGFASIDNVRASAVVVRLAAAGAVDTSFNGGGAFPSGVVRLDSVGFGTAIDHDNSNHVVVAGDGAVTRLNFNGALDQSFGTAGHASTGLPHAGAGDIDVQADDKIIVSGTTPSADTYANFEANRLQASGADDPTFRDDGIFVPALDMTSLEIDENGRFVVSGLGSVLRFLGDEGPGDDGSGGDDDRGGEDDQGQGGVAGGVAAKGVTIHKVSVPKTARKLIRQGVRVQASCPTDCTIVVDVTVNSRVAVRMRLKSLRFAHGSAHANAGQKKWVVAPLTASAANAVATYGGGGRLQIRVRAAGTGAQSAAETVAG